MPPTAAKRMNAAEWGLLILLGTIWGSSFFFGKLALAEVGPLTIVLVRVWIAAIVLHLILLLTGQRLPVGWRNWGEFAIMGFSNSLLPFCLIFWAQTIIPSALASILNSTTPMFGALVGHFIMRTDRLTSNRVTGVLLAFAGVAAMLGPKLAFSSSNAGLERHNAIAEIAVLAAALLYAVSGYYGRRFANLPPLVTATGSVTCTALMMLPLAAWMEHPWTTIPHTPVVIGSLLSLGLLSTALAYALYFYLLRSVGAANSLLVTLIIPVSGTLLGVLILHEKLGLWTFVGMGLVLLGLLAIDGRILTRSLPPSAESASSSTGR